MGPRLDSEGRVLVILAALSLGAFSMGFGDGTQDLYGKGFELRVRPVRRFFI